MSGIATPMIAPMAAGPAPLRNARARGSWRRRSNLRCAEEHEGERGGERDEGGEETTCDPGGRVADDRDGLHDGSGRDLAEARRRRGTGRWSSSGSG